MNSTFEPLLNIGIIFEIFMLFGKIPLSKDMLNIVVSGLVIDCMVFLRMTMRIPLLSVESFTITRSDNANHFFFGYWAQKHALCIFVVKVIMNRGTT